MRVESLPCPMDLYLDEAVELSPLLLHSGPPIHHLIAPHPCMVNTPHLHLLLMPAIPPILLLPTGLPLLLDSLVKSPRRDLVSPESCHVAISWRRRN